MTEHVSDAQIAASVRDAENLLAKLQLNERERTWAKEHARIAMKNVTDALLDNGAAFAEMRVITAPAALAYALVLARDWAEEAEQLRQRGLEGT